MIIQVKLPNGNNDEYRSGQISQETITGSLVITSSCYRYSLSHVYDAGSWISVSCWPEGTKL